MSLKTGPFKFMIETSTSKFDNGINNSGVENFANDSLYSFVREEVQNTLDAQLDSETPAYSFFSLFEYAKSAFPCRDELLCSLTNAENYYRENFQNKTTTVLNYFADIRKILNENNMLCLRYSDYTDCGLYDDSKSQSTPRKNLLYTEGQSDKPDGSGGSKGIGKNAAFALSGIKTVFFSSKDYTGDDFCIGIGKFSDYRVNGVKHHGKVMWGSGDLDNPELCYKNFDKNWNRGDHFGLDKFVMGISRIETNDEIYKKIIVSVVTDFFVAIHDGKLIVTVGDVVIDKNNLEDIMFKYKKKDNKSDKECGIESETIFQYEAFLGKGNIIKVSCIDKDDVEIFFYEVEKGSRAMTFIGYNGMRLYGVDRRFPASVSFEAVVKFQGKSITAAFKDAETADHKNLKPDKLKCLPHVKKHYDNICNKILDEVKEIQKRNITETTDAEGVGNFLSNDLVMSKSQAAAKRPQITTIPKKPVHVPKITRTTTKTEKRENVVLNRKNKDGTSSQRLYKPVSAERVNTKVRVVNGKYTLSITCLDVIESGMVSVKIAGENEFTDKFEYFDAVANGEPAEIVNDNILFKNANKTNQNIITFSVKKAENLALKVDVYANNE